MRRSLLFSVLCLVVSLQSAQADPKPPARFEEANLGNFTKRSSARKITHVVLHTVEGSAGSARHWFKNPRSKVSAHYIIDFDGSILQMVKDRDRAWHARGMNTTTIGIEHAGYSKRNQWTDAQYRGSARLTRWLCDTYGIPKDREHIIGHVEVPGTTHRTDPGRYFKWDYYMRLVRGEGRPPAPPVDEPDEPDEPTAAIRALPLRPGSGQTVGLLNVTWREGNPSAGYPGLKVEWSTSGRAQHAARVFVEEVDGSLRYDSGNLSGAGTEHTIKARLLSGRRYRWRVRVWDGQRATGTDWVEFKSDFTPPRVVATSPGQGQEVRTTPTFSWAYSDPDGGQQASFRIYVDDDTDHSRVWRDTKELNGPRSVYYLRSRLSPNKTYYWRVMGYDGHGNVAFSDWMTFRTSTDYTHTATDGLSVSPDSPRSGAVLTPGRPVLRWTYHNAEQRPQRGFRVQVEDAAGGRLADETYTSVAHAYRARSLEEGSYRWRVGVTDGRETAWTSWAAFSIKGADMHGLIDALR